MTVEATEEETLPVDGPAVQRVLADYRGLDDEADSFDDIEAQNSRTASELADLHIAAFAERLAEMRTRIQVLDRRAEDLGITEPSSLDDMRSLLFSHQTYKSYPDSFLAKGQWDRMNAWLGTVSVRSPKDVVDVSGVTGVDDWIETLAQAGYPLFATSGSSGKAGFVPYIAQDLARSRAYTCRTRAWMLGEAAKRRYPMFLLGPSSGPRVYIPLHQALADQLGQPGAVYHLSDRKDSVAEVNRIGAMRKAMADGTVRAEDLQQFERDSEARQAEMAQNLEQLADRMAEHQGEPIYMFGQWSTALMLIEALERRGVRPGAFPEGSVIDLGGGKKVVALPDDYQERVASFFPGSRARGRYGMSECSQSMPECTEGRYHVPAGLLCLMLDEEGERVINPDSGRIAGRAAFFDFQLTGRWGGIITSDWLEVDFSPCPCGFASTSILSVERITGPGGDDKLTCAGTIAAYIRGVIAN